MAARIFPPDLPPGNRPRHSVAGVPPEAWDYQLGNRSAVEWVLDQYKERKHGRKRSDREDHPTDAPRAEVDPCRTPAMTGARWGM